VYVFPKQSDKKVLNVGEYDVDWDYHVDYY